MEKSNFLLVGVTFFFDLYLVLFFPKLEDFDLNEDSHYTSSESREWIASSRRAKASMSSETSPAFSIMLKAIIIPDNSPYTSPFACIWFEYTLEEITNVEFYPSFGSIVSCYRCIHSLSPNTPCYKNWKHGAISTTLFSVVSHSSIVATQAEERWCLEVCVVKMMQEKWSKTRNQSNTQNRIYMVRRAYAHGAVEDFIMRKVGIHCGAIQCFSRSLSLSQGLPLCFSLFHLMFHTKIETYIIHIGMRHKP